MTCPVNQQKNLLLSAAITVVVAGVLLTALHTYSAAQMEVLTKQRAYRTPEDAMLAQIADGYTGVKRVEILHADKEWFENLWFVEARVWAASRVDGYGLSDKDSDNPGVYFLHVRNGWTPVPEGKFPEVIALGTWLFDLPGE